MLLAFALKLWKKGNIYFALLVSAKIKWNAAAFRALHNIWINLKVDNLLSLILFIQLSLKGALGFHNRVTKSTAEVFKLFQGLSLPPKEHPSLVPTSWSMDTCTTSREEVLHEFVFKPGLPCFNQLDMPLNK